MSNADTWGFLHMDTRVRGTDGFTMSKLIYEHTPDSYEVMVKKLGIDDPVEKNSLLYTRPDLLKLHLIHFLKTFSDSTFCVTHYVNNIDWEAADNVNPSSTFVVGFHDKRDMFKFTLKMPGVKRTRWWKADAKFVVIGKTGDSFIPKKAGEMWNREDPHGMVEK